MGPWPSEIFSFLGTLTGIGAPTVKGPRRVAPNRRIIITERGPQEQGSPTDKGPLQTNYSYRRCAIPTDKRPLQIIRGPYRQLRALIDKGSL